MPTLTAREHRFRGWARATVLKLAAACVALALLWTLAVGGWLPRFAQPRIEAAATQALGAPLSLGRLEIDPWALRVVASGVVLGPPPAPWLKVEQVEADLSVQSLWRLAPVLRRLNVRTPQVLIERLADERFNVSPMFEALARRPSAPAGETPARFAIHNIRIVDGRIDLLDRVAHRDHRVEALHVGVPFISNLPSDLAIDVEPLLDARVDGSRLRMQGKTQPFAEGHRASLSVDWQALDVARWTEAIAPLLAEPPALKVDRGDLALALKLDFERRGAGVAPLLRVSGSATLSGLHASMPPYGAEIAWDRVAIEGIDLQPLQRQASVASVRLNAPRARLDLPALLATASAARTPSAAAAPVEAASGPLPWQWRVGDLQVVDGGVIVQHPAWPQPQALTAVTLGTRQLDSRADAAPAAFGIALKAGEASAVSIEGTVSVAAAKAALVAKAEGIDVAAWLAPWQATMPLRVSRVRADAAVKADVAADGWSVRDGDVSLSALKLRPRAAAEGPRDEADSLDVDRVTVSGLEAKQGRGEGLSVRARAVRLDALDLKAVRRSNGDLAWLPRPTRSGTAPAAAAAAAAAAGSASVPAPHWQLDELQCKGCAFALSDRSVEPAASIVVVRTDLALRKLGDDLSRPVEFDFATQWQRGGRAQWRGSVRPQPLSVRSRLNVVALDLRMLQPYLHPLANLELVTARFDAAGDLSLDGAPLAPSALDAAQWHGTLGLTDVRTLDALNRAELVRFKRLALADSSIGWRADGPAQADLGELTLQDFYGRVIVNADARLNLLDVVRREGQQGRQSLTTPKNTTGSALPAPAASAQDEVKPAAAAEAASAAGGTSPDPHRPRLRWRRIALSGGTVDFTDNFIRPNYSAKLTDLAGSVSALAWDDPQPATVAVAGKVDGSAPLEISGTVHPLGPRLATDLTASARGIDITRLTGYSARYAGYGIEKGTLSVQVHYRIAGGTLEADNKLRLDQLTFGDKVDSPDALKLPVLLAVSLLKDRNGVIDIDLPIRGSLDDPQFSIGGLIFKVIVNLVSKAVTAPFTLLAKAFGSGSDVELGRVDFAAGSSELDEASRQRLDSLVKALGDRPALRLEATGHADPVQDAAALRALHLERLLRNAKAKSTGDLPESVTIEPAERNRWIEAAYKSADLKDKPRNVLGLAKSLPPQEMQALLLRDAPGGDDALRRLADDRGDRVKAYLATRLPPERVLLTASKLGGPAPANGPDGPRVEFALH